MGTGQVLRVVVNLGTAPDVGEWWDNDDDQNYTFERLPSSPGSQSQNRSFTAPSTMRPTPVTPALSVEICILPFPKLSSVLPSPPSLPLPRRGRCHRQINPISPLAPLWLSVAVSLAALIPPTLPRNRSNASRLRLGSLFLSKLPLLQGVGREM